uniref:Uncharacterized protein n=1 Tax=Uncultured archaeon GZfos26G2 TaxID=3386331 RepID=Q648H8_UNCAG|nr:hypothetical protein GZ37D1_46 [uncultured archaeon GZfos37D1]
MASFILSSMFALFCCVLFAAASSASKVSILSEICRRVRSWKSPIRYSFLYSLGSILSEWRTAHNLFICFCVAGSLSFIFASVTPSFPPFVVLCCGCSYSLAISTVRAGVIFCCYTGRNGKDITTVKTPEIFSVHFLSPGYKYRPSSLVITWQSSAIIGTPMMSISDFTSSSVRWKRSTRCFTSCSCCFFVSASRSTR